MKHAFIISLLALVGVMFGGNACRGAEMPEILHERIAVTLDPEAHLLTGESTVTLRPRGAESVSFALHPGASVRQISVEGKEVSAEFGGGTLVVPLPADARGGTIRVKIGYRALFNDPLPERTATAEDPSYGVNGIISAKGVFLGGGAAWYPSLPAMPGKRTLEVTAPAGIEAITAGKRLERRSEGGRSVSVWEEEHPVEHISLSAGEYVISERKLGSLPIYTYLSPGNARLAASYLDASAEYIKFYEGLFGPYPFEKFAVVENFIPTGYGFPSYTLLGGTVIRLPFIIGTSLPHEIAHNWWGNGVLVDFWEGNWAEGLVTYLADYLLEERKSPAAGRDYRFRLLTDYAALVSSASEFPLTEFVSRTDPASRAIGYGKGAMVFHMVRTMIGDDAFFGALRDLCRERLYRRASWSDFVRAFSKAAGKDLAPFMEQWLKRTGGPRLSLADVASRKEEGKWKVTGKVIQSSPYWSFPVTLKAETAAGDSRQTVQVDRESAGFTLTLSAPPKRLMLDPDADLFRVLSREEIPPAINRIKGSRNLIAVIAKGCRAGRETFALLLESLGQKGARIVHEEAVRGPELAGHDLLFCGVPEKKGLLAPLSGEETVAVSPKGFAVAGETFDAPGDALFAITGHPSDRERVAALFLPLSAEAADACVTKIAHYGKYGYLVFSKGVNRKKGVLPAEGGGTVVNF